MRPLFLAAAATLLGAASAPAESPATMAQVPPQPAAPALAGGTVVSGPALSGPVLNGVTVSSHCLPGKCAGPPCTPEVKPAKKTVYSTVTREFCVPTRSLFDLFLAKCGLADDCDGPSGATYTKTLLVKKQVPKSEEACPTCKTVIVPAPVTSLPVVPVKP